MANAQPLISVSGLELANVVMNSGLLQASWNPIATLYSEVNASTDAIKWRVFNEGHYTAIAFVTSPGISTAKQLLDSAEMVSSETLKQHNFPFFQSLCSQGNPSFSTHGAAIQLFCRIFDMVSALRAQIIGSSPHQTLPDTPLIITGHSLGGSVAALFTLFLLDAINPKSKKLPICITFGSPLIGDEGLRKAVSERSRWSSCFLHVAGSQDQVPSLFVPLDRPLFVPFGSFLFCSEVGFACVEDPKSVLLLMKGLRSTKCLVSCDVSYYGNMVETMKTMFLVKKNSQFGVSLTNASQAGIILQLEAIGITVTPEHEQNIQSLIRELEQLEKRIIFNQDRAKAMSPNRKLNEVKKKMAYLEWYKKDCKAKGIGYYDSYKMGGSSGDLDVTKHKKFLQMYWEKLVEEAERKPQKETAYISDSWLFAGTNYRRMVEPLDIAEYYRKLEGNKDYRTYGRSRHYILLEQWQRQDVQKRNPEKTDPINKRRNVAGNLTEDSCFWADVEEALIKTKRLNDGMYSTVEKQSILAELVQFEQNVMDQISDSAVSPEIFLEQSSFMTWWKGYSKIQRPFYSPLANFMRNHTYERYARGEYWENDMQIH